MAKNIAHVTQPDTVEVGDSVWFYFDGFAEELYGEVVRANMIEDPYSGEKYAESDLPVHLVQTGDFGVWQVPNSWVFHIDRPQFFKYRVQITFTTDRELSADEIASMLNSASVQIEEPEFDNEPLGHGPNTWIIDERMDFVEKVHTTRG